MRISKDYVVDYQNTTYQELDDAFAEILAGNNGINQNVCIEGISLYNLTRDEALHLLAYTAYSAKWINGKISNNATQHCLSCQSFIYYLDKALEKIPSTTSELLYRVIHGYYELPKLGDSIVINYYLSTSLEDFNNSDVLWKITPLKKGSKGKDVTKITNNKGELEIIFCRNTRFRITEITEAANRTFVHLIEEN